MASCKYYDCGFCYAPDDVETSATSQSACFESDYCPYLKSQMTDLDIIKECRQTGRTRTTTKKLLEKAYDEQMTEIEEVKAQIKVLEKKLALLEELEKTKSPVEEAYKDAYGKYPVKDVSEELTAKDNWNVISWDAFQMGYNAAYEEKVAQEPEENEWKSVALRFGEKLSGYLSDGYYNFTPEEWFDWVVNTYGKEQQIKNAVRESVKWCEEHPDKDPLDWVKPQTPEQVADGLKEAFREAVKQGVVSSTKSPTLYDVIADWWDDTFTKKETSLQELVDKIEEWLPKEQSAAGSQNVYVECTVEGFNDCLNTIKRKLR